MWPFSTPTAMPKDSEPASIQTPPQVPAVPTSQTTVAPPPPIPQEASASSIISGRSLKQFGLFLGGACFLSLSTLITRRSIARKNMATIPRFYTQSNRPVEKISSDSSMIAIEALNLATLNVVGFGIMMAGGISWAFDISSIDDMRRMARRHIGPSGGQTDEEAEREIEEWVAKILLRKEEREQKDAAANSKTTKGD